MLIYCKISFIAVKKYSPNLPSIKISRYICKKFNNILFKLCKETPTLPWQNFHN